jgi:two-component system response regulator
MGDRVPATAAEILLLSQRPDEADLVRSVAAQDRLHVVDACNLVLPFLRRERDEYRHSPRPNLILLDLDLHDQEHCDTLIQIKADPDLRSIPLVVMSYADNEESVVSAYDLHANAYVHKPRDPADFVQTVREILHFWLKLASLPGSGERYA